jgi:hypothetical protein
MSEFIMRKNETDRVPDLLLTEVPDFINSAEYKNLGAKFQKNPGVLCGAFKDYFIRLQEDEITGRASREALTELERCYNAIEKLAGDRDASVSDLVVVEIWEHLWCSDRALERIWLRMGPNFRKIAERFSRD